MSRKIEITEAVADPQPSQQKQSNRKRLFLTVASLVLVLVLVAGVFYFNRQQKQSNIGPDSVEQAVRSQVDDYLEEVGKLYALPENEEPRVATVEDKQKLQDQEFFANAENGDVTLMYPDTGLAILYRPSSKQLINVSGLTVQSNARVKVVGMQRTKVIETLKAIEVEAQDGGDTIRRQRKVIIVDLSGGRYSEQAQKVAQTLGAAVGDLPEGEARQDDADILVIAGQ